MNEKNETVSKSPTLEEAWSYLQETGRLMRESAAEAAKRSAEAAKRSAELDKLFAETEKQLNKMSKKVDEVTKQVGGIKNSIGEIVEGLMTSDLFEKFKVLGYDFDDAISNCTIREKGTKRMLAEVDMLMLNGTIALAIEVKTTMTIGDVDNHLKQMNTLHNSPNNLLRGKKLYGAMAGAKMTERAKNHAIKRGFFVLQPSGRTVTIMKAEKLAEW
jgi:hypothetical protein